MKEAWKDRIQLGSLHTDIDMNNLLHKNTGFHYQLDWVQIVHVRFELVLHHFFGVCYNIGKANILNFC